MQNSPPFLSLRNSPPRSFMDSIEGVRDMRRGHILALAGLTPSKCLTPPFSSLYTLSQHPNITPSPSPLSTPATSIITSLSLALTLLPFSYKDSYDYIELTQIIQDDFPISRSLM